MAIIHITYKMLMNSNCRTHIMAHHFHSFLISIGYIYIYRYSVWAHVAIWLFILCQCVKIPLHKTAKLVMDLRMVDGCPMQSTTSWWVEFYFAYFAYCKLCKDVNIKVRVNQIWFLIFGGFYFRWQQLVDSWALAKNTYSLFVE